MWQVDGILIDFFVIHAVVSYEKRLAGLHRTVLARKSDTADHIEKDSSVSAGTDFEETKETGLDAGCSIEVTEVSSYSGPYMEDASDQEVSDVLMIKVRNTGEEAIQYAEVTLFADVLNIEVDEIKLESRFVDDLGADSLDIFQIIMGIEEIFDIEIDNSEAEKISTVKDAVEQIKLTANN